MRAGSRVWVAAWGIALCLVSPPAAASEEVTGGGTVTYTMTWSEAVRLPEGAVQRYRLSGVILADDVANPFHLSTQDCNGTTALGGSGKPSIVGGYCDAIDAQGDVWWISWSGSGQESRWTILGGTGKYEGMTGSGTAKWLTQKPDGRGIVRWDGTWRMK